MSAINDFFGSMQPGLNFATQASGLIGSIFRPSLKKQYNYQKKFLGDQTEAAKSLYDHQFETEAEYNDPANYFKRLLNGADQNNLSKAAVIGGGAAGQSGVQHQGMPSSGSGTSYDFAASDIGSKIMQNSLIGAQIRNLDSQSEKNRKESGEGGTMDAEINFKNALAQQAANNSDLLREKALSEPVRRGLMKIDSALRQLDVDNYQTITDAKVKKILAEADKAWQDSVYRSKENNFYDDLAEVNIAKTRAQIYLIGAQAIAQQKLAQKYGAEYVRTLQENEQWNRTIDYIVQTFENDAKYAGVKAVGPLFSGPSGVVTAGLTAIRGVLRSIVTGKPSKDSLSVLIDALERAGSSD